MTSESELDKNSLHLAAIMPNLLVQKLW